MSSISLKDARLATDDGILSYYYLGLPVEVKFTGYYSLSPETRIDTDRRIICLYDCYGKSYLAYRSPDGFKYISLGCETVYRHKSEGVCNYI